jgi:lipopolysaccharide transport system permease protein
MSASSVWEWRRDMLLVLLRKELVVRYKGSVFGFFWSVLNPLSQAVIFYLVFGVYMRFNVPHYLVGLLAALFPWQWFANCIGEGPHVFSANPTLVKKIAFPRQSIPLVMNLQHMAHFLLTLPVYVCFMAADGLYPGRAWIYGIPLLMLVTAASIHGLCLLFGSVNLFFRDMGNLISIFLQMAFFATPIMYTLAQVPERFHWCFKANPVAPLFICWRSLLLDNRLNWEFLLVACAYACLFLLLGYPVFAGLQRRFAEVM